MGDSSEKLSGACLVPKSRFVGGHKLRINVLFRRGPSSDIFVVFFPTLFLWGSSPLYKPAPKGMVFEQFWSENAFGFYINGYGF